MEKLEAAWLTHRGKVFWFLNSTWFDACLLLSTSPLIFYANMGAGTILTVLCLLIGQNASFTMVSRARQLSNIMFVKILSAFSNGFFIFVITAYAAHYDNVQLKFLYIVYTLVGTTFGLRLSLWIEKFGFVAKDALVSRRDIVALTNTVSEVEARVASKVTDLDVKVGECVVQVETCIAEVRAVAAEIPRLKEEFRQSQLVFDGKKEKELRKPIIDPARTEVLEKLMPPMHSRSRQKGPRRKRWIGQQMLPAF
ncbi:MAG: hypothetical protein KW793_03030 [Candidatus Doudnabacteria bacterium]|nr:hypothetical protein [Candidatus Doudnabacteria bacterium]